MNYEAIVQRHRPKGWRIEIVPDLRMRGLCAFNQRIIWLQRPVTDRETLFVYLHEVGHVQCWHAHDHGAAEYVLEYEAERYAIAAMRNEGLNVPLTEIWNAKENVRDEIEKHLLLDGGAVDPKIKRWSMT